MTRKILLAALLVMPGAAYAQNQSLSISVSDCQRIVRHQPAAGVDYTPGVDVHGKAVTPADLGGGTPLTLPETIDIQIGIDLADRLALRDSRNRPGGTAPVRKVLPFSGTAALGTLSVRGNDLYWNGERLVPQDEALLASACRQGFSAAGIVLPTEKPEPAGK